MDIFYFPSNLVELQLSVCAYIIFKGKNIKLSIIRNDIFALARKKQVLPEKCPIFYETGGAKAPPAPPARTPMKNVFWMLSMSRHHSKKDYQGK